MTTKYPHLSGKRVMVVEDELLVAIFIEDVLADVECIVVGPFSRVQDALVAAESELIDFAVMDVNVSGIKVFPVAYLLEKRGVPFLFLTGYGQAALPLDRPDWEACAKPFHADQLAQSVARKLRPI